MNKAGRDSENAGPEAQWLNTWGTYKAPGPIISTAKNIKQNKKRQLKWDVKSQQILAMVEREDSMGEDHGMSWRKYTSPKRPGGAMQYELKTDT